MMKKVVFMGILMVLIFSVSRSFSAYHHMGEKDSGRFLSVYPDKAGTKLDHCALCHSGGQYEKNGSMVNLGSCQWCHYSYGYDGNGNILTTINAYGKSYHDAGRNAAAVKAIEDIDSDGDGFTNKEEIEANRFPGEASDDPTKKVAPFRIYSKAQLETLPQHTQFLLMNASRQEDAYVEYTGVPMEVLLNDAGILDSATGIKAYAPDGWSNYHPLDPDPDPELYHIRGIYPPASFQYDSQADIALGGWCKYDAPSCVGRNHNDPIFVKGGLKAILAVKRDGAYLTPGILTKQNKLDGEGPFRLVVPQKNPTPPDQASTSKNQNVIWPYENSWDHNAGACSRTVTIIKVEPLPPGTTDIDLLEAGWNYVDQEKIIIYGAIKDTASPPACTGDLNADGSISPQDALLVFRCYLGLVPCHECADINGDGIVTPADALCLLQKYLGLPSCFDQAL